MSATTVISTEKEESAIKTDNGSRKHSVYNYMKGHASFLVACVSAFVAVISFALNYAASRYTGAYLQFWMVDTVYAKENNTELIYTVLFSLLYTLVIVITNKIMAGTADAFGFYNKILTTLKWYYKDQKKEVRKIKRKMKKIARKNKSIARKLNKPKDDPMYEAADKLNEERIELTSALENLSSMKRDCRLHLVLDIAGCILCVLGLVSISVSLMNVCELGKQASGVVILATIVVIFYLLIYIVPVYCSTRVKKGEYASITLSQLREEIKCAHKHRFPIAAIAHTDAKELLSNRRIRQLGLITVLLVIMNIGMFSITGKTDAEKAREFPVYVDETGTYAVVYNNGESLVLKSAEISGNQIEIDVRNQKVISATDVSYQIRTFETVVVTGKDGG